MRRRISLIAVTTLVTFLGYNANAATEIDFNLILKTNKTDVLKDIARTSNKGELNLEQNKKLEATIDALKMQDTGLAQTIWMGLIFDRTTSGGDIDINALSKYAIREAYLETNEAIRTILTRVRYYNAQKKELWAMAVRASQFQDVISDPIELEKHQEFLDEIENRLGEVEEDANLAELDLETWVQTQQQLLQTVSEIEKLFHDIALAVIRKFGG